MDVVGRKVIYETRTKLDHYEVIEEIYTGRRARLLYSAQSKTAQSGIPLDNQDKMLFEYNQRLAELVDSLRPREILVIGGGVYTLPTYLQSKYPDLRIEVVEPDAGLDELASRYFNFKVGGSINIVHDFGLSYLNKNKRKYDLIVLDAYLDQEIPAEIRSKKFAKLLVAALNKNGLVAANVISDLRADSVITKLHASYRKYFKYFKLFPAAPDRLYFYPSNLIYVASKDQVEPELKYPALRWSGVID